MYNGVKRKKEAVSLRGVVLCLCCKLIVTSYWEIQVNPDF